ncbi:MAG: queuosine salvage family protein [Deltaproteobacteria bacterium]|nr:queuosine salvage family protein [Deltaproteobacteria bacterium]
MLNKMMSEVLETSKKVSQMSRHVRIDRQALGRFVRKLLADDIQVPRWAPCYHFCDGTEKTVAYLLVLDTINFCFWPPPGKAKWEIEYQSERLSGYYALAASLKRAFESAAPVNNAGYLADLSLDELVLLEKYDGNACRLVEAAENSALKLVRLLAENFSSFNDVSEYQGQKVFFYKRAQILTADLYGAFNGKKWGSFTDMDKITAFADYKLPQVLRHLGIMRYTESLTQKVDQELMLEAGCPEEIEIRANLPKREKPLDHSRLIGSCGTWARMTNSGKSRIIKH